MHLGSWSQWMLKVKGVEYVEFVGIMLRHVEPSLQWCFFWIGVPRGKLISMEDDGSLHSALRIFEKWRKLMTIIAISPHHHVTISPHHYITSSPHHLITTSLHHHITTPHQYSELVICKAVIGDRSGIASSRWRRWGWNRTKTLCFLAQSGSRRRCGEPCLCDLSGRSFGARVVAIVSSMRSWWSAFRHAIHSGKLT